MPTDPHQPPKGEGKLQFSLWQLFASVLCLALSFGLFRVAWVVSAKYGPAAFTWLCVIGGILLLTAGIGVLFKRALLWAGSVALGLLRLFLSV